MARRKSNQVPGHLLHKSRDRAYVNFNGEIIYLPGKFNSPESRAQYDRLISFFGQNRRVESPPRRGPRFG